ncbi:DUF2889 domain-containing protein [Stakelama tenebrarum]|uniref:DUF2889 domain-containing protein n=1 Tax=Stakelama tenebrarum TaxID=2711215 RepID=A0A6G6Y737_9SPHN|nr:DUF2889 domain-containing protein [Sphingosinithalassobacter tenebrarum]QIG80735.1 DUF2889 domain-containing protein [Sphingosinithalassobacter tenebrarum]
MAEARLDDLPGFRRRFRVVPEAGLVRTAVEDDYHHMAVTLHHDGAAITQVEPEMIRIPWTTCPGAVAVLVDSFTGMPLDEASRTTAEKQQNCTHLFDLAVLGAAHAGDDAPLTYDILSCDAVDGEVTAELRRDGEPVLRWSHERFTLTAPEEVAGQSLFKLGDWIKSLSPERQEYARILRWGTILANGRDISDRVRTDKSKLPIGQCYTFQEKNRGSACYIEGTTRDFSSGRDGPLAEETAGAAEPAE